MQSSEIIPTALASCVVCGCGCACGCGCCACVCVVIQDVVCEVARSHTANECVSE